MKITEYLRDKRFSILFYFLLMGFISLVISLDNTIKVNMKNIIYINFVTLTIYSVYLLAGYLNNKRYYKTIKEIIDTQKENIINILPYPKTNEQKLNYDLMRIIYDEQTKKIEKLNEERIENLEFVTSWVHEVKTPIAVSRLIIENNSEKPKEDILNSIEEEFDKIEDHVERALYYARVDAFSKDYFINDIDIEKLLKDVIKKNARSFISKKIKVEIENASVEVTSDKKWLFFIIDQIITNSLKYIDNGGFIKIYTEKDDKEKRLIIEDDGIGIKREDLDRVFEKGFTGYTGRQSYKSTGMGLYLAKKLSMKLGHYLSIESKYGEFTRVTIHFPKLIDYYNVTRM